MEKNKVKSQTLLKIALVFFFVLFVLSVSSLFYFRFYFRDDISVPSYIRFLADSMMGSMGYVFYTVIPGAIVLIFVIWILLANRNERLICELEKTIPKVDNVKMQETPFQDIVCKSDDNLRSDEPIKEVVTQTLKSPIVSKRKSACVHKSEDGEKFKVKVNTNQQFAPKYIFQNDISSISELKKIIAAEKLPEVCICSDGDLSNLSEYDKEQMQKINSLNTNDIFAQIKKKNLELDPNRLNEKSEPKHTYRVVSKHSKLFYKVKVPDCKKSAEVTELKYLTADEIVALHRKEAENKKFVPEFVPDIFEDDNKALNDMAKFYYESHIDEYKEED